ncbi:LytTR family DNA-binding domain-containing protein [Sphingomonas sp. LaA6.9]|uniref:LytTR family DNA-binding domain-containing protein n=1 Tax=Sphingomonas sp. LaA6.9 TaxID=2919914 RepID=UPI001F501615|nr:LytTR family DNA-binding domain-containing protein [Sphingomonas sp. LaA6.9]MCJ8157273.1 LytTR family transcriptional regulator [Sphingomonas sp. LaA6.9]
MAKIVNSFRNFVTGGPMQLAMREWRMMGKWRGPLSAVAFGALLGVTGPFGSQTSLGPAVRYPFWMIIALVGFGAAAAAGRVLPSTSPGRRTATRIVAVAAASAVPMTFFVAWAMGVVRPGRTFSPVQLLALFPYVALVQLLIARVISPDDQMPDDQIAVAAPAEQPAAAPEYPSEFVSKLPVALRRDILALEAEDHYVRVHTLHGSALVLMRLADAAAIIDPRLGLRVHRSWWVAKNGVRAVERSPGRAIARLVDDTAVPISRTYLSAARTVLTD